MNNVDKQYLELCQHILDHGVKKEDRTGTGTLSVFGYQMRFDLSAEGFPLLTTKYVPFRLIAEELLWFLSGSTNVYDLLKKNNNIWLPDAYRWFKEHGGTELMFVPKIDSEESFKAMLLYDGAPTMYGDLGRLYGKQFRAWKDWSGEEIDQVAEAIKLIKHNPDSRRIIIDLWHVGDIHFKRTALPSCHNKYQFYVANGKLSCMMECRSNDVFLGQPFNIASGALLTHMVAQQCGLEVGELVYTIGDAHIYLNHIEQVKEQLQREPRALPTLKINPKPSIDDYTYEDFELIGYDPHPAIKGEVSVG